MFTNTLSYRFWTSVDAEAAVTVQRGDRERRDTHAASMSVVYAAARNRLSSQSVSIVMLNRGNGGDGGRRGRLVC